MLDSIERLGAIHQNSIDYTSIAQVDELHDVSGGSYAHPQVGAVILGEKKQVYVCTVSRIVNIEFQKYCLFVTTLFQIVD
jgi:hypothetical protein